MNPTIIINFYFHDPSTKNHFIPIADKISESSDRLTNLIDLRDQENNFQEMEDNSKCNNKFTIGFYGLSTNQIEIFHKGHDNIKILYIESLVGERLNNIQKLDFDFIFVANNKCYQEIKSKYNNQVILVGDTHYNHLNILNKNKSINLPNYEKYFTIFLSPDDEKMDKELCNFENYSNCLKILDEILPIKDCLRIRFHPRSSNNLILFIQNTIQEFTNKKCNSDNYKRRFILDESQISNFDIIKSSKCTFSIASTMSFESIILGVPSTFINLHNKFTFTNTFYETDHINICTNKRELEEFIHNPVINKKFKDLHFHAIDKTIMELEKIISNK